MVERAHPESRLKKPTTDGPKWGKIEERRRGTVKVIGPASTGLEQVQAIQNPRIDRAGLECVTNVTTKIRLAMATVVEGKPDVINAAITVLLAEGHLLIEDVPGVGKTMPAKALAKSIDCSVRRVQFSPTSCPTTSPESASSTRTCTTSSSSRARSLPTSWSATRSTAPLPRCSQHCWNAWRRAR